MSPHRLAAGIVVLALAAGLGGAVVHAGPGEMLSQIRSSGMEESRVVAVRNLKLEMGPAIFEMERGVLVPAEISDGRILELVFIGHARLSMEAPDAIEAGQLALFTGERSLDAPIDEAVLVLANPETVETLLDRPAPVRLQPELLERARGLYADWLKTTERRTSGVESAMFKSLVGDEAFDDYFALWCRSFERGDFIYMLDPEDSEPITLAKFLPVEVSGWERRRLARQIRIQQRKGRWLGVRLEDLGAWDVWVSSDWSPPGAEALPGNVGFETEHYEIDVKIKKRKLELEGRARLNLRAGTSGRRVVRLDLMRDMRVLRVEDGDGRELFFFRSGEEIVVLLPRKSQAGEPLILDVTYRGRALKWVGPETYDLGDTSRWHPHCGTLDRATYDVTLRWPKRFDLIGSGHIVAGGRDEGYAWERRRIDVPSIAFSFVLGDYIIDQTKVGDVNLTMAFSKASRVRLTPELRSESTQTAIEALKYYERLFGPYPLEDLVIATVPREFSQSYLGFVALSTGALEYVDFYGNSATWLRDTTIAHELAHQWWGNLVGWWSYRDQWLSEGMANFAALLYDQSREGTDINLLGVMSMGWRESLNQRVADGRTIESLGPVVLGHRLNSSKGQNGYRTIVYRKGAAVLAMLARSVGEETFLEILASIVSDASNRILTTEAFLDAVARLSGVELDGFASQYVYGTGIPKVYYNYRSEQRETGEWNLEGAAYSLAAPFYRHEVIRSPGGHWDLRRTAEIPPESGQTTLMVPYRLTMDDDGGRAYDRGKLFIEGRQDRFRISSVDEPIDLQLDPQGEILATFYSAALQPKRVLQYRAHDLAVEGRLGEAEVNYLHALEARSMDLTQIDPLRPVPMDLLVDEERENTRIQLALVRLYLDQDRDAEAETLLDRLDRRLEESNRSLFTVERETLRSRLEIRRGEYVSVHRRLKKTLRFTSSSGGWRDRVRKMQLLAERDAVKEAYALLAIAAYETGHTEEFDWAMREAMERGVEVAVMIPTAGSRSTE